jgi:hypothetical protein
MTVLGYSIVRYIQEGCRLHVIMAFGTFRSVSFLRNSGRCYEYALIFKAMKERREQNYKPAASGLFCFDASLPIRTAIWTNTN